MKRYRIMAMSFDSRPLLLDGNPPADPSLLEQWKGNRDRLVVGLTQDLGSRNFDMKLANFRDLGSLPFSVLSYHNDYMTEIRRSFVIGCYYPALTGACTLAERMLNHMLLGLRDSYRGSPEYKKVASKDQIDNWSLLISTLDAWGVLRPGIADRLRRLEKLRNQAVHWGKDGVIDARAKGLDAIRLLQHIVEAQFGIGDQPWFIPETPGEMYLKKAAEVDPFVRFAYVPNGQLVGPNNAVEILGDGQFVIRDDNLYPDVEITDEEFVRLWREAKARRATTKAP